MIEQLFGSKTRVKLLHLFFTNPNRAFYVREITRKIDEQINSVRRELANLLSIGIISSDSTNNKLYYEVNQSYKHYKALRDIFTHVEGSEQLEENDQARQVRELGDVKVAYLMGRFVRNQHMPVDLFLVGDVNETKLSKYVKSLEDEQGFEINYTVLHLDDFEYRKGIGDRFVTQVLETKKTVILDTLAESDKSDSSSKTAKQETDKVKEKVA